MKRIGFLLFRLNFVDRHDLFQKPITDDDFASVVEIAATERFDYSRNAKRSDYRWALRQVIVDSTETQRPFIYATFSCQVTARRGPIILPSGITQGTSLVNPPSATLVAIIIDLKRHIVAVEDVPSVVQVRIGWRKGLQTILNTAAWNRGFTSLINLDPIAPAEAAARARSLEKVTRLRVTLRIPNPDLAPSFKRLYDEMKQGGVREFSQDMRNERGLNLEEGTLPKEALEMALVGYRHGKIHVYGYRDGHRDDVTIADDVARIEVTGISDFVEGYAAGSHSSAVKRLAKEIIDRIDEMGGVGRK